MLPEAKKIVITGAAGFIGSHMLDALLVAAPKAQITVIDKFTYAGCMSNLRPALQSGRVDIVKADICDKTEILAAFKDAEIVIHTAAESHVDRSYSNSKVFLETNISGTQSIIDACLEHKVRKLIHFSSDEVYGPRTVNNPAFEDDPMLPSNPYSASKAAAEMLLNAAKMSHGLPVVIVRPNNIYGTRQYPEKLIPKVSLAILSGEGVGVDGNGQQIRHFLSIEDVKRALILLINHGVLGEVYNIGVQKGNSVLNVMELIAEHLKYDLSESLTYVEGRPFNDQDYQTNFDKIKTLGWQPQRNLEDDIAGIIDWVRDNRVKLRERLRP